MDRGDSQSGIRDSKRDLKKYTCALHVKGHILCSDHKVAKVLTYELVTLHNPFQMFSNLVTEQKGPRLVKKKVS